MQALWAEPYSCTGRDEYTVSKGQHKRRWKSGTFSKARKAEEHSILCNIYIYIYIYTYINAGSITLHEALHDEIVALMWEYRLIYG